MFSFLKNMSAMKATILLCVIAAGVLGYMGWQQHKRVQDLRQALGLNDQDEIVENRTGLIETQAVEIQAEASKYTELRRQLEGDNLRGDGSPQSYIRGVASNPSIQLGGVKINFRNDSQRGYEDNIYTIVPQAENTGRRQARTFQRTQLANFMYRLEEGSKRVKVTSFKIDTPKPLKPEDFPDDRWGFTCAITVRNKTESSANRP